MASHDNDEQLMLAHLPTALGTNQPRGPRASHLGKGITQAHWVCLGLNIAFGLCETQSRVRYRIAVAWQDTDGMTFPPSPLRLQRLYLWAPLPQLCMEKQMGELGDMQGVPGPRKGAWLCCQCWKRAYPKER